MKDIKHISRVFYSVAWVMPQGWDLGKTWSIFSLKFNQIWCVSNLPKWHMQRHKFFVPLPLRPWGGAKWSNIIKSQFQRFLNQTLCDFSQMKDINYLRLDFHSVAWVMSQEWDLGVQLGWGSTMCIRNSTRLWCVGYLHDWHMQRHNFWVPAL